MKFLINSIFIISLIGTFLFFYSCKKDDDNNIIIQGKIIDANQNIAVANAEVTFWSSRIQSGAYNPNYIAITSAITDAGGNYNLQIIKAKDAGFRITIEKPKYFGQTTDISVENLPAGTNTLNYSIYPEAYFKMIVKNISFVDNNDFISYWFKNTQPSGANCCNNVQTNYTGQSYSNIIKCRTFGGQNMIVKWIVRKDNVTTPYESSVYCAPFDTTVFNLNY
jgi:hypothetical protein